MAFSHSFHAIGPPDGIVCPLDTSNSTILSEGWGDGNWSCALESSYIQSAVMFLSGDWVYLDNVHGIGIHTLLSMSFAFIVGILLLNIIIALISKIFTEVENNSEKAFWSSRLRFVNELQTLKKKFWLDRIMSSALCRVKLLRNIDDLLNKMPPERRFISDYDPRVYDGIHTFDLSRIDRRLERSMIWFYGYDLSENNQTPHLFWRIAFVFVVSEWKEVFPPSKGCRKILMGKNLDEELEGPCEIFCSWLAGFVFFLFCIVAFPIVLILGFATFGYLWPKELKEVLFCGTVEVATSETKQIVSSEAEKVKTEVNMLHRKVEERIEKLEEKTDKILELLQGMHNLSLQRSATNAP